MNINLSEVRAGSLIQVTAGEGSEVFLYEFAVLEAGKYPTCDFSQTSPDGTVIEPAKTILEGTGQWTTPEQNPVQRGDVLAGKPHQEKAFSIGHGILRVGQFITVLDATNPSKVMLDRYELLPEVKEIRVIS